MAANYFDQFDPSTAKPVDGGNFFDQFDPSTAKPEPKRTLAGTAGDLGVVALKGAVGLPQAAVGLLDIPTGGHVGRALEGAGVRFKDAQDTLDTMYSPAQQAANRKVREAEGFVGTARAMLENPSTIATGVGESLPQMLGGAGVARGLLAAVPKIGAIAAGALGEGVMGAGSAAEQIREQTPDGLLTGKQAALAGASGTATAALGGLGGKVAQRLGVGDVDTMLASGAARAAGPGSTRSMPRQIAEGAVAEGVLEEMPQSMAEQALQNVALDKPVGEGVGAAAAQGLITGAAMGGVGGGIGASGNRAQQRAQEQATQAAEAPTQAPAGAETLDAAPPAMEPAAAQPDTPPGAQDQNEPGAPDAAPPTEGPVTPEQRIAQLEERLSFIQQQAKGNGWDQRLIAARDEATQELEALRGPAPEPAPEPVPDAAPQVPLSAQMGIDPTAGPLSRSAAIAVDSGASQQLQEAQFLGATGRDLQLRRAGPGLADDSRVIDVQGRVVEDTAIGTPRRLTTEQGGDSAVPAQGQRSLPAPAASASERARQSGALAFADGVPRSQIAAIPNVVQRAQQLRGYDEAARQAQPQATPALPAPTNLREGLERIRQQRAEARRMAQPSSQPVQEQIRGTQAQEAIEAGARPAQAGAAQATALAVPGAPAVRSAGALTDGAPAQDDGAARQAAPAQAGQAQAAAPQVERPKNWRTSMLGAAPVARGLGLSPKGKRLAQVVAEIDAAEAPPPAPAAPAPRQRTAGDGLRSRSWQANPMRAFLAKHGVSLDSRSEFAPGLREMRGAMVPGYGPMFRKTGKSLDTLAQAAVEEGFLAEADEVQLYQLIDAAVRRGERVAPQYTGDYAEREMRAEMERRQQLEREAAEDEQAEADAELTEHEAVMAREIARNPLFAGDDADIPLDTPESNISTEQAMRLLGFTEEETREQTERDAARESAGRAPGAAADGAAARAAPAGDGRGQEAAREGQDADAFALNAPTRGEVLQRQQTQEQAQADEARQQKEAERRAEADGERDSFTLTGSDRAADVAAAQGQQPMFSRGAAAEPASLSDVRTRLDALGVEHTLSESRGVLTVNKVVVPEHRRNAGAGTAAMQAITDYADAAGVHVALTPSADFGGNKARLTQFYKRFGFKENKGRAKVYEVSETMVRENPQGRTLFSRSADTQAAYEARIDALFAGEKPRAQGVRVLDRSDVLALLGLGEGPVHVVEGKVEQGRFSHGLSAQGWKMVPEWLESPAAVFDSDTSTGRLVFIAPELVRGSPVRMIIDPRPDGNGVNLLINAYDAERNPFQRWEREGLLRYFDKQKAPAVTGSFQPRLAGLPGDRGRGKILTEKDLAGYRRANGPAFSFAGEQAATAEARAAARLSDARLVATQQLVDGLKERWSSAPEIIVARNMEDEVIPQHVRDYDAKLKSQGATGEPQGFILGGKVYLLADALQGPNHIATVLFHEVLGHYGLRRAFGDALSPILRQVAVMRGKDVRAKAREYGLDWSKEGDRLTAAEEVLAEMAQANPQLGFVQRAISAIRNWLRAHVPGFKSLRMTNQDIIRAFILPARGAVTRSSETTQQALERALAAVRGDQRFSRSGDQTQTEAFQKWFGDSKVVDAAGKPLVVYHGTRADISNFSGERGMYFSRDPSYAGQYSRNMADVAAGKRGPSDGGNVMPVYLRIENPKVFAATPGRKNWQASAAFSPKEIADLKAQGYDGIINEDGNELVVFDATQIKSAIGNKGTFDPSNPDIRFSRSTAATAVAADYTPAQASAAERAFGSITKQTLAERAQSFRANLGTRLRQGLVDQFAPIKEVSEKAYVLARLSKGSDGAVEAALLYGKPFLRDGVYDVDMKDGGFAKVLAGLKGEDTRFFQWVAAQRAERLKAEGKENLLTDADISALKSLNTGRMADGTARTLVYAKAMQELNAFNEATLKVAMESGLIDQEAYDLMKDQPYVPFYRLMEDGDMRGPRFSSGLVNQQAWKKLKGGTQQINADLLQNTLLNWSHLYAAAARNRASLETMAAADKMGIAYQVSADTKGAVKVMRDGVAEHWAVEDPYLLDAISALSYAPGGLVKAMAPFKRLLTFGVTVNPAFKIRNLIRDSLSAIAQSDLGYNPLVNVASGWKATSNESQTYASMLASGGVIKFGTQENADALRDKISKMGGVVLDNSGWGKLKGQMKSLWEVYEEFGDRTENVNRAALYERLISKGHSHAEAAFMARDLMDFSMSGKWEAVRFLAQTVPFLNARLQGLYKLGRAAKEDPRRFGAVVGAVSLASLGLLAAYGDDDDWKKREDWDRDSYWWFKIGDTAFRIPKPFEVGAIGTLAERTAELMMSDEMTGKRFGQRISDMVFNTFAMDPTPQFIKPFIDVYANKDSFSGRAIEGMADERLRPQDRFNERTSEIARLLGSWGLPDPVRLAKGEYAGLSPKQIDFLLRGYFGWLATVATTAGDMAARPLLDRGERPAMRLRDAFLAGNFVESLPTGSSRYVSAMYEQARNVEQVWASHQAAVKAGDMEKAREIEQDEAPSLRNRMAIAHAKRQVAELSQQAKRIEANRLMPAEEKRRQLDEIEARKHRAAQRVAAIG